MTFRLIGFTGKVLEIRTMTELEVRIANRRLEIDGSSLRWTL